MPWISSCEATAASETLNLPHRTAPAVASGPLPQAGPPDAIQPAHLANITEQEACSSSYCS